MSENTDRYDARKLTKERTKDLLKEYVISGLLKLEWRNYHLNKSLKIL